MVNRKVLRGRDEIIESRHDSKHGILKTQYFSMVMSPCRPKRADFREQRHSSSLISDFA